jgi:choice-of-anchor B domain-containing protein
MKAQQSENMELLANWNDTTLTTIDGDQKWSDIMGYYDSINKKEYAIMMGNDSFYFFDITNPTQTKLVWKADAYSKKSINRDVEIYDHYAYCVAEKSGTLGGMQIFDLKYLPDSVHEIYRSNELSVQAHTLFIEAKSKRLYICQNSLRIGFSALDILSLENPEKPIKLASLNVPLNGLGEQQFNTVHEMYSRNDTVYLSCYENGLYIMDLTNLNNQKLIGSINNYPQKGTNHSSWLNQKGNLIMFTDENQGSPVKIFDMSDLSNPKQVVYFNSNPNALPHNAYWNGNMAVVSSYEDGVYVYDLTVPSNPKKYAFYDTYPKNETGVYSGFHGCWGVWPFLPSGNIIASDISEGLFVLKIKNGIGVNKPNKVIQNKIYPNPAKDKLYVVLNAENNEAIHLKITDYSGKLLQELDYKYNENFEIDVSKLQKGIYIVSITAQNAILTKKIVVE